jgi:DNA repair photolyase
MLVNEIFCKSILSRSRLYGCDFSINPYRGCEHACIYCYAPYILREQREWGSFVDVKVNAPEILVKDMLKAKRGVIYISSVTDPYQPLEKKYELTRKILEILKDTKFFVSIQTKSSLVLRDIDLLKKMDCEVGFTITSLDENARKVFEPNTSSIEERLKALKELKEAGISTYIFFGPFYRS